MDEPANPATVFNVTQSLCRKHDLTAYDAAYLEIAMRGNHALATADVKLYPLSELAEAGGPVDDVVNGRRLRLHYDRQKRHLTIRDGEGKTVEHFVAFLPDLRAFYPRQNGFK